MVYEYFRLYNFVCIIFGLIKPVITTKGRSIQIHLWCKLWSLLVAAGLMSSYYFSIQSKTGFDIKRDMEMIADINDLVANIIILIINIINSEKICMSLHEIFDDIFNDLNVEGKIVKLFAYKMYFWSFATMIIYLIFMIMEFLFSHPPFILFIRIPTCLSIMHLIMHLYLIAALLKVINNQVARILISNDKVPKMISNENIGIRSRVLYIINPDIEFMEVDNLVQFDLKLLCKIYDNLTTCIHLLEKCYGLQVFLSIWLMFTSAVVGVTVIANSQPSDTWLVIIKSGLPFFWCFIGCYINDVLSKEVDQTTTLIIKCLIDYKCVQSKKPALETFKELVKNDRLQFTACSLFNLSYSMLLGALVNVLTYSIILIQLF